MSFGYVIVYVDDVSAVLEFYGRAFGLETRFMHESGQYGELETGSTALAFASHEIAGTNLPGGYARVTRQGQPFGVELGLVTANVDEAFAKAVAAGAGPIAKPAVKPWGQTVAYVRSLEGTLIELCTPVSA